MRPWAIAGLILLASCAGSGNSNGPADSIGLNVAEAALRGGSPQAALHVVTGVLEREPGNPLALTIRGDGLTMLHQYEAATTSYQSSLRLDPNSVRARIGLGRLMLGNNPREAERLFQEALDRSPADVTALVDMGIARDLQRRHADAQQAYRRVLAINPDHAAGKVNLALSLAMSGSGAEAERLILPLVRANEADRKLRHNYAAVLALSGRRDEAERILEKDLSPAELRQAVAAYQDALRDGPVMPSVASVDDNPPLTAPVRGVFAEPLLSARTNAAAAPPARAPVEPVVVPAAALPPNAGAAAADSATVPTELPAVRRPGSALPLSTASVTPIPAAATSATPRPAAERPTEHSANGRPVQTGVTVEPAAVASPDAQGNGAASADPAASRPDAAAERTGAAVTANATPRDGEKAASGRADQRPIGVQLASLPSEEAAHEAWNTLRRKMPKLLDKRRPRYELFEHEGKTFWRLRTGSFANNQEATTFCLRIRSGGGTCIVGRF